MMMIESWASTVVVIVCGIYTIYYALRMFNSWWYKPTLKKDSAPLPPGDMGWPFLGNMLSFLRAFKSTNPEAFISSFVSRFRRVGLYKAFMFGKPTILATCPEVCKLILMDDVHFIPGWPKSAVELIGSKSFVGITFEEHKRLRKLTAAPVTGNEVLSKYLTWIEQTVDSDLEKWSKMDKVDFLTHIRKLTFDIIAYIFLSNETNEEIMALEREYTTLNLGVRAMAINLPGTAYNKALKARKNLVAILQSMIDRRRAEQGGKEDKKVDMLDVLLKVKDQHGRLLEDEEIIDLLVMYLNAGHESSGHMTMWTVVFLLQNPEMYAKAKAEQEDIVRRRPEGQKNLVYSELREMEYLHKVINESLRLVSFSSMVFREALDDVELNGYTIPKGWRIQIWMRNVHLDPEVYPHPKKFDPERWENFVPKPGMFVPFGLGSRLCPGSDLAKMEICVFIHCMLLQYEIQRLTPDCKVRYLPHPRPADNCPVRVRKLNSS
ncbi:hypothetical protein SUGI_0420520 [Cryptomeria japonica]|uniref:ent-kaurenoic acid oxidase 2 n=1 Tax=Cryptomeria japonica TaxID=3369 RepID=UPI002408EB62|nr:ent-kaurenoic acid oxidase 2 [Cryptomeria japonica]GLJ22337.1 hypothetical protein SUGI_0420520 [Cryptomeria japonica]